MIITVLLSFTELESHNEVNDFFVLFLFILYLKILATEIQLLSTGLKKKKKGKERRKKGGLFHSVFFSFFNTKSKSKRF